MTEGGSSLTRRAALVRLAAPALAGAAAATSRPSGAQTAAPAIRVVALQIDAGAEAYYAADMGFFQRAGLNADVKALANGAAIAAALASGSVDFGIANCVALATAHEHGVPVAFVAPAGAYSSRSPTVGMVVAKTSPIRTAQDVAGKTIAVSVVRSLGEIALRAWLDQSRVDASTVKIVEMKYSEMDAALAAGRIDVALIEEPVLTETLASHGRFLAKGYDALAKQFCEAAWFCTADYARARPEIVRRFADAMARTAAWANANQGASQRILEKYSKATFPPGVRRCYYPERLNAADFQPVIDASARYGVLKAPFPARDLFAPGLTTG